MKGGRLCCRILLCCEDSLQRRHDLRQVFNEVRYAARTGRQWRYLPHEYGPWWAAYQQMHRWLDAGLFEVLVADVQSIVREWAGRKDQPTPRLHRQPHAAVDARERRPRGPRRSQAARARRSVSQLIPRVICWRLRLRLPIGVTANRSPRSPRRCSR